VKVGLKKPTAVTDVTATAKSGGKVLLAWKSPAFDGGSLIKKYKVVVVGDGKTVTKYTTSRSLTLTKLKKNKKYVISISATNSLGYSAVVAKAVKAK
jgi:hypothetical protein